MLIAANCYEGICKVLADRLPHAIVTKGTGTLEDVERILAELSSNQEMFKGEWSAFSYSLGTHYNYQTRTVTERGRCVWLGFADERDAMQYRLMIAVDQ
jgi:hypothetical protein